MKSRFSALIVEDEELAQELLKSYIGKTAWLECAGVCDDAVQSLACLREKPVDMVFIDVQMPAMSGMELIRTLHTGKNQIPAVILTTAYSDYALESYDLNVVDYLLKPFSFERYIRAVNKAATWLQARPKTHRNTAQTLPIRDGKEDIEIPFGNILYCESWGNYVKIHTATTSYITHQTLKSIESVLPEDSFCRIHKTVIVALSAVQRIEGNCVILNNRTLPIGVTYGKHVSNILKMLHP